MEILQKSKAFLQNNDIKGFKALTKNALGINYVELMENLDD